MKKLIFALLVVAALFVVALPAAAQGPVYPAATAPFNWAMYLNPNTLCTTGKCVYVATNGPAGTMWAGRPVEFGTNVGSRRAAVLDPAFLKKMTDDTAAAEAKDTDAKKVATFAGPWEIDKFQDPFGGWPLLGPFDGLYQPGAWAFGYVGVTGMFGPSPSAVSSSGPGLPPGGRPSKNSFDGKGPRRSIMIGGAWKGDADGKAINLDPQNFIPIDLPTCATLTIPPGQSRWFKMDSWKQYGTKYGTSGYGAPIPLTLQIWLDEEVNNATTPSGSSVWGAATSYLWGVTTPIPTGEITPALDWTYYYWGDGGWVTSYNSLSGPWLEGFVMAVYDPDAMKPNYVYDPPNAILYTLGVSGSQGVRRGCTAPVYDGAPCFPGVTFPPAGASASGLQFGSTGGGTGYNAVEGYGQFNPRQPSHLLWYEGTFDGWVHTRVYNQMVWPGTATVCSFRSPGYGSGVAR